MTLSVSNGTLSVYLDKERFVIKRLGETFIRVSWVGKILLTLFVGLVIAVLSVVIYACGMFITTIYDLPGLILLDISIALVVVLVSLIVERRGN